MKYVKLPNDRVVGVDNDGFIAVNVEAGLSIFIDNDLEGVLDCLSDMATGTEVLCDVSYAVVGHKSNTLVIRVVGDISMIAVDEVALENLPLQEFEVEVTRIGYGNRTLRLSARTEDDAKDIADDDAGNHNYSEHHSEYIIEARAV